MTDDELGQYIQKTLRPALYRHVLFRSHFRMSREEIEDIVQDALLRCLQHRDELTGDYDLPWLYTVIDRIMIDKWRKLAARANTVPLEETKLAAKNDTEDVLLKAAFTEAFMDLGENEQRVLYGMSIGKTQEELADELGVPQTTVAYWARTGKQSIRSNKRLSAIFEKGDEA